MRAGLALSLLVCEAANAAALVSVPGPKFDGKLGGLEPNRGQAKPEILFLRRGAGFGGARSLAIASQYVLFSPAGVRLSLVDSAPAATPQSADPLPGVVNSFTGADPRNWITGVPRYATARLPGVYPGVDAEYAHDAEGRLTLRLLLKSGVDPTTVRFDVSKSRSLNRLADGTLLARLGPGRNDPVLYLAAPLAFQQTPSGLVRRDVQFELQSESRLGFLVAEHDAALPLQIHLNLEEISSSYATADPRSAIDAAGNFFAAATVSDAAGKAPPFPGGPWEGCGAAIGTPVPCSDVAVYKFSAAGELIFASYFAGRTSESAAFVQPAPDGTLMVTGSTDSSDFPATPDAFQPTYAGPAPGETSSTSLPVRGDFFALKLDANTGALRAGTFLGGPEADSAGEAALGADGSVYFVPKWLGDFTARMPTTRGALQGGCAGDPCANGYAARLSPSLDRLLYGTYLPGRVQATARLHADGSVYYAGAAETGFPTSPTAYQRQFAGKEDGIVARLDPTGSRLLFATYLGGVDTDWILRLAVAPDGSAWVSMSSFVQCCIDIRPRLVRLDASGERLLADRPLSVGDLAVDRQGNLFATVDSPVIPTPDAFLRDACAPSFIAYVRIRPNGDAGFATYLPGSTRWDFDGASARGLPILRVGDERYEVIEEQPSGVYAGCVVDAASFLTGDEVSPGAIVTLFGTRMGPARGVPFQLVEGWAPVSLGGTRVLVNGEPAPLLYVSDSQIHLILPYTVPIGLGLKMQVEFNGVPGNELRTAFVKPAGVSIFRLDGSAVRQAAALNEDGTVNSTRNPARPGSRLALFGTGGGATAPPSIAGEVTPLELRPLANSVQVEIGDRNRTPVLVEYAGGAPGLLAGVTQVNVKLPDVVPEIPDFPRGIVPLFVVTPLYSYYPGYVTVAVKPE